MMPVNKGRCVGVIDQGSTSTRFMVRGRQGRVFSSAQRAHRQICPRLGRGEHDAPEIWANTDKVIEAALAQAGMGMQDLVAEGITIQRIDGGSVANESLMQSQADILYVGVARPLVTGTTAPGAG